MGILGKKKKKEEVNKFYSLKPILAHEDCKWYVIFGERSNGKTYAVLKHGLEKWVSKGEQTAIIRRWKEDFTGKRGKQMYANLVNNDEIRKLTGGEWTTVVYYSSQWFLARVEGEGTKDEVLRKQEEPFAYGFALTDEEHDKSTGYPKVTTILFDEFISRHGYLPDEFVTLCNTISTIVRSKRPNLKIFMCANTVNKYNPYFVDMGLTRAKTMQQGEIDLYTYGDTQLKVAVEYCKTIGEGKDTDVLFAFDNPKLKMITKGEWEIDIYPHCPKLYKDSKIKFVFFILYMEFTLQCEIVKNKNEFYVFIHLKTSELKNTERDLIYSTDYDPRPNWRRNLLRPELPIEKKIYTLFKTDKVFYQDNEIGEVVRNYLQFCKGLQ